MLDACSAFIDHCIHLVIFHAFLSSAYFFYAPNFEKVGSILLSACASMCPSVQKKFKLGF